MFVYYDESILSYVSSIREYFGLSSSYKPNSKFLDLINNRSPKKIFLLLVDGMGANLIEHKLPVDSFLRKNMINKVSTVFPATTVAATTSIRNGKAPNENAWLGWVQYLSEVNDYIIPFTGIGYYNNTKYGNDIMQKNIPVVSMEDELNKIGIKSRALLPSFSEDGCDNFDIMCDRLTYYSNNADYEFIYAYWDEYDSCMHEHGPNSKISDEYLVYLNSAIDKLASSLSNDTMLIVLADHGQIEVEEEYNLYGSKYDKYLLGKPSLEARACMLRIKEGMSKEFEQEFKKEFEDRFILLDHNQILETKLFGDKTSHQRFEEFIGDYIAIGKKNTVLVYKDYYEPMLKGQHSGICDDELFIPIIVHQN